MTSQIQILRRQELDAFLATAFSNDLMNALHLQEMTVSLAIKLNINHYDYKGSCINMTRKQTESRVRSIKRLSLSTLFDYMDMFHCIGKLRHSYFS